jgi:hypothetical protein
LGDLMSAVAHIADVALLVQRGRLWADSVEEVGSNSW